MAGVNRFNIGNCWGSQAPSSASWEAIGPFLRFEGLLPNMLGFPVTPLAERLLNWPPARHKTSDGLEWVKTYTTRTSYLIVPKLGTILTYTGAAGFWPTLIPWYLDTLIPWSLSLSPSLALSLSLYHYPTISPWDPYDIPINHHCNQMRHSFPLATKALCLWRAQPGVRATWQRGGLRFTGHPGFPSISHGKKSWFPVKQIPQCSWLFSDENQAGYPEYHRISRYAGREWNMHIWYICILHDKFGMRAQTNLYKFHNLSREM